MKRLRELRNQAFFPRASIVFPVTLALEMDTVLPVNEKTVYCSKRKKRRFCDHCDRLVSIRTFNAHKRRKTVDDANIGTESV